MRCQSSSLWRRVANHENPSRENVGRTNNLVNRHLALLRYWVIATQEPAAMLLKNFILWIILLVMVLTQLLLYIPIFSCRNSGPTPVCLEQFRFSIVGASAVTEEFISSIKEVLRLVSYLAIDMGWSTDLGDSDLYREENLVDTFDAQNTYKVNYLGYCKRRHNTVLYCAPNGHSGMDVLGILVRDIGIQLGMLSSSHVDDTTLLGNSMVLTYHLALSSLEKFLKAEQTSALSKMILLDDDTSSSEGKPHVSQFARGVALARFLQVANGSVFIVLLCELSLSALCLLVVLVYGLTLILRLKLKIIATSLKFTISTLMGVATITFLSTLLYFLVLKTLEPSRDPLQMAGKWDIMQVSVGPGFIIGCIRYALQVLLLPLIFVVLRYYKTREEPSQVIQEPESAQMKDLS